MCECDEVTARHHVRVDAEAVLRDSPLELGGKEPVVGADQDAYAPLRPRRERAGRAERRVALRSLAVLEPGRVDVVEEVRLDVEFAVAAEPRGFFTRLDGAGGAPPAPRCLAGHGDHRVDEDKLLYAQSLGSHRRGEAAE